MLHVEALRRLQENYSRLSPSERAVADYVRSNHNSIAMLSLQALAQRASTSEATVLRFCRSVGYSGYQDFKTSLVMGLLNKPDRSGVDSAEADGEPGDDFERIRARLVQDINETMLRLDRKVIEDLAQRIAGSRKVMVVGVSGSAGVASVFAFGLLASGVEASHPVDRVEIERLSDLLSQDTVVIGISHSGNAPEVADALRRATAAGCFNVALTHFERSAVARAAQNLVLTVGAEPLLGSNACHPRALQLVVLEAILDLTGQQIRGGSTAHTRKESSAHSS